ncbi:helix-turn-helix domain-containing protein [Providencia hangzhouensis]|uniref:helix-turn-helix domain-containing protein n=1 Tax=Providencia hangzhouensis TaxID=3031799 RepID=UPI0034DD2A61
MPYSTSHLIGKKILFYRKTNGLSVNELSEVLLASAHNNSHDIERGVNRITLDRLFQYATYFEIDIQSFFNLLIFNKLSNNTLTLEKQITLIIFNYIHITILNKLERTL